MALGTNGPGPCPPPTPTEAVARIATLAPEGAASAQGRFRIGARVRADNRMFFLGASMVSYETYRPEASYVGKCEGQLVHVQPFTWLSSISLLWTWLWMSLINCLIYHTYWLGFTTKCEGTAGPVPVFIVIAISFHATLSACMM